MIRKLLSKLFGPRPADAIVVQNSGRKLNADFTYTYVRIRAENGYETELLLTKEDIQQARHRANQNQNDCPTWAFKNL